MIINGDDKNKIIQKVKDIQNYSKQIQQELESYKHNSMIAIQQESNNAVKKLEQEAVKMYDEFITQFYEYETKSYIRYDQHRPGTKEGTRLFYGQDFGLGREGFQAEGIDHRMMFLTLKLKFSPEDMPGSYRGSKKYGATSKTEVFDLIMNGIRGIPGTWTQTWSGKYAGDYFSYEGVMQKVFNDLSRNADTIAGKIFVDYYNPKKTLLNSNYFEKTNKIFKSIDTAVKDINALIMAAINR